MSDYVNSQVNIFILPINALPVPSVLFVRWQLHILKLLNLDTAYFTLYCIYVWHCPIMKDTRKSFLCFLLLAKMKIKWISLIENSVINTNRQNRPKNAMQSIQCCCNYAALFGDIIIHTVLSCTCSGSASLHIIYCNPSTENPYLKNPGFRLNVLR